MAPIRSACVLLCYALLASPPCAAEGSQPLRPYSLRLSPNAIQDPHTPLRIDLDGPPGEKLQVLILPGCGSKTQPAEPPGRGLCKSPLVPVREVPLDLRHGHASIEIRLDGSDGQPLLPVDVPLWLRVATTGREGGYRQARFSIAKDRCAVWQSLLDQFGGGRCMLGLDAVFDPTRSSGCGRLQVPMEVRRIDPRRPGAKPQPVAGTHGATGAAWDSPTGILVTLGAQSATPGLYHVDVDTSSRTLIYEPSRGFELTAPLPLPGGRDRRVAVIEMHGRAATLLVLRDDQVQRHIPLSGPVHQLLRTDASGKQVIGVRQRSSNVDLFSVVLQSGIETTGGDAPLLLALRRSPSDGIGVLEYEDPATTAGWQLLLFDRDGKPLPDLLVGPGSAILPAWRTDGRELLYLGQVDAERKVQP